MELRILDRANFSLPGLTQALLAYKPATHGRHVLAVLREGRTAFVGIGC